MLNIFNINTNYNFPSGINNIPVKHLMSKGNTIDNTIDNKHVKVNPSVQNSTLRIMLADDDIDDRDLFAEAIHELALNVSLELVEDGNELLTVLLSENYPLPHVLFLDLNMPNKNGRECLEIIRSNERLKNIVVVIYSTSSSQRDIDDTFEKGANLYVRKASSFSDLLATARKVLSVQWDQFKPHSSRAKFLFSSQNS